jgi:uncharacterized protein involved in response to NO
MTKTAHPDNPLLTITEPLRPAPAPAPAFAPHPNPRSGPATMPLLRLGFRPFYLLAALTAALVPPLWLAMLTGAVTMQPALPPSLWHGHEMIFGFVVATVVGFLFTAGKLWTGLPTPTGAPLAAFALLWLAARITALTGPYAWFLVLDAAFLPLVAALFASLVARSKNWRNLPIALLLALLASANLLFHASLFSASASDNAFTAPRQVLQIAVLLLVAVVAIVAGRVIPSFIGNVVPGSRPRTHRRLEQAVLPVHAVALLLWVLAPVSLWTASAMFLLAALHALRLTLWRPWDARGKPILWVLPAAYAWIPAGLALLGGASAAWVPASIGIHALTVGAMGALIVGMMSRTARGHTGRLLQPGRAEIWAYVLVLAGALVRVAGPLFVPSSMTILILSAALWSGAYALILWTLAPWLVTARLDGKAG